MVSIAREFTSSSILRLSFIVIAVWSRWSVFIVGVRPI